MRRILYVQYTNPAGYPPLQHGSRLLADAGWHVLFLGTGAHGADALDFPPHPAITVRRLPFQPAGWRQKLHYLRYALAVFACLVRWRPCFIYASDPLSCPIALVASRLPGVRVIYHEHDSPAASPAGRLQRLCHWARARLARRAAACVLPNRGRLELFRRQTGAPADRCHLVWNCPDAREARPQPREPWSPPLRLYYHGNLSAQLVPLTLLHALARLPRGACTLTLAGYLTAGNESFRDKFLAEAAALGLDDAVTLLPPRPRHELWPLLETCHVGLALFPDQTGNVNLDHLVGASNKVFDYWAAGLAVLVADRPAWRAACVEPGLGRACDSDAPDSIATALRWFLDHPDETRALGERGRRRILDDWNYQSAFAPVLALVTGDS